MNTDRTKRTDPMKRLTSLAITLLALALWTGTASAHTVPDTSVFLTCSHVMFNYENFPIGQPVILHITVTQGDQVTTASVNTQGATEGVANIPLTLHGTELVTVEITWALGEYPNVVTVTRQVECTPTTTPPTTTPPTTSPPTTEPPTTVSPPTTVVEDIGTPVFTPAAPVELANTGASHTALVVAGAWLLISFGAALLWGSKVRRGVKP